MAKDSRVEVPPMGIGAVSSTQNVTQWVLMFEMAALVFLEGFSWYLAGFAILLLHGWNIYTQCARWDNVVVLVQRPFFK